jgi:hypothetical protein
VAGEAVGQLPVQLEKENQQVAAGFALCQRS